MGWGRRKKTALSDFRRKTRRGRKNSAWPRIPAGIRKFQGGFQNGKKITISIHMVKPKKGNGRSERAFWTMCPHYNLFLKGKTVASGVFPKEEK